MQHAVADETETVARDHADLAHALAQCQGCIKHRRSGLGAAYDLQQLHDVRRTEEVQAQDLLRAASGSGYGVDIQRRGIAGQNRFRFEQTVEFAEDFLLQLEVFVDRFDNQINIADRRVIGSRRYPCNARIRLGLIDPPLTHVVGVSVSHAGQRLLKHLRIVIDPLHRHPGAGQAHDNATAHGARTNHGGALNIERCLAHGCCSLIGDPKTVLTIVSRWVFLKFIPVMGDIQRMDASRSRGLEVRLSPRPDLGIRIIFQHRKPRNRPRLELGKQRHADPAQKPRHALRRWSTSRVLLVPVDKITAQRLEIFIHKRRQYRWFR